MDRFSYDYPETVWNILQDAKPVNPNKRYGNLREGHMSLYQGTAGRFIVHIRQDRESPIPEVRVLTLPENVPDADAERYAQMHPDTFLPWQYMIQL